MARAPWHARLSPRSRSPSAAVSARTSGTSICPRLRPRLRSRFASKSSIPTFPWSLLDGGRRRRGTHHRAREIRTARCGRRTTRICQRGCRSRVASPSSSHATSRRTLGLFRSAPRRAVSAHPSRSSSSRSGSRARRQRSSSTTNAKSTTRIPTRKRPSLLHSEERERPFLRSQSRQIAHVCAPPSVSVQQSPHTERRHDAHGPAASAEQKAQRSMPSPPSVRSAPLTRDYSMRSTRPSACFAKRVSSRGCTGSSLGHGQPPYWVRW